MILIALIIISVSVATLIAMIRDDRRREKERAQFVERLSMVKRLEEQDWK